MDPSECASALRSYKTLNGLACGLAVVLGATAQAADATPPPGLAISRAAEPIKVDGDLSDAGWKSVMPIGNWYETNPGDNTPPKVKNVGYLAYDDKFFYAAFEFGDPAPSSIRAPLGDRDNVPSYTDYGGVILDTRNDGRTGLLLLANARGIQYDAVSDDGGSGEDSSPDFYWDAVGRITPEGWVLEMRIPFSSLRYAKADPQTWGIMLYRNYPREFRYQFFSTTLPRGGNCFICRSNKLTGLAGLPTGGHLVLAPYANASRTDRPEDGPGSPFQRDLNGDIGLDVKWTPSAQTALDATINPDFSQIESDVAQIAVNERFALFFPEKRPFFLEGIELFSTPIQAVYTRTITAPRWGVRSTGKVGSAGYTALLAEDSGGGSVILPGSNSSDTVDQDFRSFVAIGRVRRDIGRSFVSFLGADREIEGGGHNRVFGPDFQWRPTGQDAITGQALLSRSRTPNRPDLTATWDGRSLAGHAAQVWWSHSTPKIDWYGQYNDLGDDFRADNGFVPQVGYRSQYAEAGHTFRPSKGWLRRFRSYLIVDRSAERDGDLLFRQYSFGVGMDARWNSFVRIRYAFDKVRSGDVALPRRQLLYTVQASPSQKVSYVSLNGFVGEQVDFTGSRVGTGASVTLQTRLRPTDHLELAFNNDRRWLNVGTATGKSRLFRAGVDRLRTTYSFTSRVFLRAIVQWVETVRDPALYSTTVARRTADLTGSALFAYKLNWQTVLFLGYGDNRTLTDAEDLAPSDRQFFIKLSYALQR